MDTALTAIMSQDFVRHNYQVIPFLFILLENILNFFVKNKNEQINESLIRKILKDSFILTHSELCRTHIDVNFSGTTCVTCLIHDNIIYTANSGDSRAIIISSIILSLIRKKMLGNMKFKL